MQNQIAFFSKNFNNTSNTSIYQNNPNLLLDKYPQQPFHKGTYIFLPEEYSKNIYFIIEGKIQIGKYLDSGQTVTKSLLGKGDLFGEEVLFGIKKHRCFARARSKTLVCIIPIIEVQKMLNENTNLSFYLMDKIGAKVFHKEKQIESLVFKTSRTRIIEFILELVEKKGIRVGYEQLVNDMLTHQEIADLTATSRQTVTTILSELKRENILTINRKRMLIRDMEKLVDAIKKV